LKRTYAQAQIVANRNCHRVRIGTIKAIRRKLESPIQTSQGTSEIKYEGKKIRQG